MIICLILEPARHCRFCCCSHQGAAAHEQQQFVADPTVFPPAVSPLASKLRSIQDSVRVFWKRIEMDSRGRIEDNCHARGISYAGFILDSELRSRDVDSSWQLFYDLQLDLTETELLGTHLGLGSSRHLTWPETWWLVCVHFMRFGTDLILVCSQGSLKGTYWVCCDTETGSLLMFNQLCTSSMLVV